MMNAAVSRVPTSLLVQSRILLPRVLSTQAQSAVRKFQQVMHDYRLANYTQETPYRFRREVVAAAKDADDRIAMDGIQRVLNNIGASEKLTLDELGVLFAEIGENGSISPERMAQLI